MLKHFINNNVAFDGFWGEWEGMGPYEWKTFFRATVSIPLLLGQPYQIQPYGTPRADERLQIIIDNDEGSGYVVVCAI